MPEFQLPDVVDRLIEGGRPLIAQYGVWAVFLGLTGETFLFTGFWVPGILILVAGGYLAAGGEMSLPLVLAAGWLGAVLGDVLSFGLGYLFGGKLLRKKRKAAERALRSLEDNAPLLLLTYHYSPFLRWLVPCVCGSAKFAFRTWAAYDVVGVFVWIAVFIAAGFFARGATHAQSNGAIHLVNFLAFAVTIFVTWILARRPKTDQAPSYEDA
jgi:membrane protein DedA with SNARE-associated domain